MIHRRLTVLEQHRANKILSKEPKSWTKDDKSFLESIDPARIELSPATKEALRSMHQESYNYFMRAKACKILARDRSTWTIDDLLLIGSMDLSKIKLPKSLIDSGMNADIISQSQT